MQVFGFDNALGIFNRRQHSVVALDLRRVFDRDRRCVDGVGVASAQLDLPGIRGWRLIRLH